MTERSDLLVEIGTEELPPASLRRLSEALTNNLRDQLEQNRLAFEGAESFATPRRLGVLVRALARRQPDQALVRKGPALGKAFDAEGAPTKAALGFARSCGMEVEELEREETKQGCWLVARQVHRGQATADLILPLLEAALRSLPIAKRMRWGNGEEEFVRPVHWVVVLFGHETVPGRLFGLEVGCASRGHRFHYPHEILLASAGEYEERLVRDGRVQPSFQQRRAMIEKQVRELAGSVGGVPRLDDSLLEETTALCEWPVALLGEFDRKFLEVPPEVLVETMERNQKYFAILGEDGALLPRFITICNIESADPTQVRAGNERVIRPRFEDAAFFWRQDTRQPLDSFFPKLERVVFHERLGTIAERSARIAQICRYIGGMLDAEEAAVARAAHLAKCDLVSHMVFEFPNLQGTMGRYYAELSGEDTSVAKALEEQYLPRYAGDRLPVTLHGQILSMADRLDGLSAIFALGERPTGEKDPYGARRTTIGLLRIMVETPLDLDLLELLEFAAEELREKIDTGRCAKDVFDYAMERLKGYLHDNKGMGLDAVEAVLARQPTAPSDISRRILAVEAFRKLPEAVALTSANKRIRNILRKAGEEIPEAVDASALVEPEEKDLADRVHELGARTLPSLEGRDYEGVLRAASAVRPDVDAFFDRIMVMTDNRELRRNRLALLRTLEELFLGVADISLLQ
jgi:glycyl-tRNA synthetase beta chain